ncbi:uncharacterized protein [Antennarius striatus]|uniref:uncharacterized protein n=1 Tax=Antennarius striatus TaxID=241820 RepID=UPI0035B48FE0
MDNSLTLNFCDRFPPLPSAITFCNSVLESFDTFERIQLSLDGDYKDCAGLSNSLVPTSLPGQLSETPQQQLHNSTPESESNKDKEEVPAGVEEEAKHLEYETEFMANGFLSSDYSWNEPLNFVSEADLEALRWPEQQPNSESAWNPSECIQADPQSISFSVSSESLRPNLDMSPIPGFEMRKQFNMVLKEMSSYFDISTSGFMSDSRASPECHSKGPEAMEDMSSCDEQFRSPNLSLHGDKSSDEDHSLALCGSDPVVSCSPGSGESEQEVPHGSQQEASRTPPEEHTEPQETEKKKKMWSPSFTCRPFLEQLNQGPPERARKLEPLRTCSRPIRVGLSKRAKTKRLHCPHPYK